MPKPDDIELSNRDNHVWIKWDDGHESVYPLDYLRRNCPCIECSTARREQESDPLRVLSAGAPTGAARLRSASWVGSYAINLTWEDGHDTGIYTFEYLYALCPCEEHSATGSNDG